MTSWLATLMLAILAVGQETTARDVTGRIPASLGSAIQVQWVSVDADGSAACETAPPDLWRCRLSTGWRGMIVVSGEKAIAAYAVGFGGSDVAATLSQWGRLMIVEPNGNAPEDRRDLRASAWKPDHPPTRPAALRLTPTEDRSVHILRISDTAFWLAGEPEPGPEAFLLVESDASASKRLRTSDIAAGPVSIPFYTGVTTPAALTGRVQDQSGQDAGDAEVELFEPLAPPDPQDRREPVMIRRAKTRSAADGTFAFERLEAGTWLVAARHRTSGRATVAVSRLGEPLVIRLVPPTRATGRVLQKSLPVAGARIRFIPNVTAWMASVDPRDHLVEEASTSEDGRFTLPLPPEKAGLLQVIGPDGGSVRVGLLARERNGTITVGDIAIPDTHRVVVRLNDGADCRMSAAGPGDRLGITVVYALRTGMLHVFELPEPGMWWMNAECGGRTYSVNPSIVSTSSKGSDAPIDVQLVVTSER